jgi:hypothetical protein
MYRATSENVLPAWGGMMANENFEWMRGRAREGQTHTGHVVLYYGTKMKGHDICLASLFPSSPLSFSPSGVIPRNFE